ESFLAQRYHRDGYLFDDDPGQLAELEPFGERVSGRLDRRLLPGSGWFSRDPHASDGGTRVRARGAQCGRPGVSALRQGAAWWAAWERDLLSRRPPRPG